MTEETIAFDVDSLTLGEMAAAETASGLDSSVLLSRTAHRMLLVVFVQRSRSSGKPPLWSELENLRLLDARSSTSPSSAGSPSETSQD
jgi:hypothetical protein